MKLLKSRIFFCCFSGFPFYYPWWWSSSHTTSKITYYAVRRSLMVFYMEIYCIGYVFFDMIFWLIFFERNHFIILWIEFPKFDVKFVDVVVSLMLVGLSIVLKIFFSGVVDVLSLHLRVSHSVRLKGYFNI